MFTNRLVMISMTGCCVVLLIIGGKLHMTISHQRTIHIPEPSPVAKKYVY